MANTVYSLYKQAILGAGGINLLSDTIKAALVTAGYTPNIADIFRGEPPPEIRLIPPYAGQEQEALIDVPACIAYRESEWEEGPWVMPPYAWIFPHPAPQPIVERGTDPYHHEWLKTHPRPPRYHGDWRPKSVLPPFVPAPPIMKRP